MVTEIKDQDSYCTMPSLTLKWQQCSQWGLGKKILMTTHTEVQRPTHTGVSTCTLKRNRQLHDAEATEPLSTKATCLLTCNLYAVLVASLLTVNKNWYLWIWWMDKLYYHGAREKRTTLLHTKKNVDMLLIHFTIAKLRYLKPEPTAVSMQCGKRTGSEGEGVTEWVWKRVTVLMLEQQVNGFIRNHRTTTPVSLCKLRKSQWVWSENEVNPSGTTRIN